MMSGTFYALLAGFWAASASLSAKLTLTADHLQDLCVSVLSGWTEPHGRDTACNWLHIFLRMLCVVLFFACNAIMWNCFSKALRHCSSSAMATVTTTSANFIFSAAMGRLILGETQATLWWVGIALTLCGLLALHRSSPQPLLKDGKKDK